MIHKQWKWNLGAALLLMPVLCFADDAKKADKAGLIEGLTKKTLPSIVKVYGAGGIKGIPAYATGVIIDSRGMVLTAWSAALRTKELKVVDDRGVRHPMVLHRHDYEHGLALLKTRRPPTKWKAIEMGDSDKVTVGAKILSFGNAFDVAVGDEKPGVSEGSIIAIAPLDARIGIVRGRILGYVFLTDAPNNPGTRGGPVVTLDGQLIAINGRVVESRSTNTPLNFSIPVSNGKKFIAEGIKNWVLPQKEKSPPEIKKPPRLWLGLEVLRFHFNRAPPAYIDRIAPRSPAAKAGLEVDDLIFQINGHTIRTTEEYDKILRELEAGKPTVFTVKRFDMVLDLTLIPEKYKEPVKSKEQLEELKRLEKLKKELDEKARKEAEKEDSEEEGEEGEPEDKKEEPKKDGEKEER